MLTLSPTLVSTSLVCCISSSSMQAHLQPLARLLICAHTCQIFLWGGSDHSLVIKTNGIACNAGTAAPQGRPKAAAGAKRPSRLTQPTQLVQTHTPTVPPPPPHPWPWPEVTAATQPFPSNPLLTHGTKVISQPGCVLGKLMMQPLLLQSSLLSEQGTASGTRTTLMLCLLLPYLLR